MSQSNSSIEENSDYDRDRLSEISETWSDWQEDELMPFICLFCKEEFIDLSMIFNHMKVKHGFDFKKNVNKFGWDYYQCVKVFNFIRKKVLENVNMDHFHFNNEEPFFNDDNYLLPILEEDRLLMEFEDYLEDNELIDQETKETVEQVDEVTQLKNELKQVKEQFLQYKQLVKKEFYEVIFNNENENERENISKIKINDTLKLERDLNYFDGYSYNDIHEEMIKDKIRTEAYRDFIEKNHTFFKDKVVMDVGCGTGILSLFAARVGAAKVYAIDNSKLINTSKMITKLNHLDHIIHFIHGKVEEIHLPNNEKVDIIISEWMGYFLLYEAMLDSVLIAKQRFLKEGGILCPNYSQMIISGFSDNTFIHQKTQFWENVYGFNMSPMQPDNSKEAIIDVLEPQAINTTLHCFKDLDLMSISSNELEFTTTFELKILKDSTLHGLVSHFDTLFSTKNHNIDWDTTYQLGGLAPPPKEYTHKVLLPNKEEELFSYFKDNQQDHHPIAFTTGPHGIPTHWKQTIFVFDEALEVLKGETIQGTLVCKKYHGDHRGLVVELKVELNREMSSFIREGTWIV